MKKEQSVPMQETENNVVEAERVNTTEFPTVVAVEPEYKGETTPAPAAHAVCSEAVPKGNRSSKRVQSRNR